MNTKQLICCAVALFPSGAGSADATVGSQVPLIVREWCKATPLQNAGTPPRENGEARTGPTQDEYRKVPFRLSGGTYFTLPGKNRHFGSVLQLLNFDPLMVPDPVSLGWVGGVDPSVAVIPDPSLKESPLPGGSMKPAQATEAELESE